MHIHKLILCLCIHRHIDDIIHKYKFCLYNVCVYILETQHAIKIMQGGACLLLCEEAPRGMPRESGWTSAMGGRDPRLTSAPDPPGPLPVTSPGHWSFPPRLSRIPYLCIHLHSGPHMHTQPPPV